MHQISVYFILPETKGISLERMDKIFGEVDAVAEGEKEVKAMETGMEMKTVEQEKV